MQWLALLRRSAAELCPGHLLPLLAAHRWWTCSAAVFRCAQPATRASGSSCRTTATACSSQMRSSWPSTCCSCLRASLGTRASCSRCAAIFESTLHPPGSRLGRSMCCLSSQSCWGHRHNETSRDMTAQLLCYCSTACACWRASQGTRASCSRCVATCKSIQHLPESRLGQSTSCRSSQSCLESRQMHNSIGLDLTEEALR